MIEFLFLPAPCPIHQNRASNEAAVCFFEKHRVYTPRRGAITLPRVPPADRSCFSNRCPMWRYCAADDSLGNTDRSVPDREAFTVPRFSPDTFIVRLPLPAGKPSVCKTDASSVTGVKTTKNSVLIFRFIRKARLPQLTAWNPQSSLPHRVSNPLLRNMR